MYVLFIAATALWFVGVGWTASRYGSFLASLRGVGNSHAVEAALVLVLIWPLIVIERYMAERGR